MVYKNTNGSWKPAVAVRSVWLYISVTLVSLIPSMLPVLAQSPTNFFTVRLDDPIDSELCGIGQTIHATLVEDLLKNGQLLAPKGATVRGHIVDVTQPRRFLGAEFSPSRWMNPSGAFSIEFSDVSCDGKHISLYAVPVSVLMDRSASKSEPNTEQRVSVKDGYIAADTSANTPSTAGRFAIQGFSLFGGRHWAKWVGGTVGAVAPGTVLPPANQGHRRRHKRLKGFATGFVDGVPGGIILTEGILKGQQTRIEPGRLMVLKLVN